MELISLLELSRRCKRSSQFIDKQKNRVPPVINFVVTGKTASGKDKVKVNADGKLTRQFIIKCLERGESEQKKKPKQKPAPPKPKKKPVPVIEHAQESETETYEAPATEKEKHELEKEKLVLGNEKIRIDNDRKRGKLIPKILVKKVFGRIYSIDENQLKEIGVNVAPKISAAYSEKNREKTTEILKLLGKEKDKELKTEINKILNTGEPDLILETRKILEDSIGTILKSIKREIERFLTTIKELGK